MGCAASYVTIKSGGLLLHLFTLANPLDEGAVVFCHIVPDVTAGFPLESMAPFVARTFLSVSTERQTSFLRFVVIILFFFRHNQFIFC